MVLSLFFFSLFLKGESTLAIVLLGLSFDVIDPDAQTARELLFSKISDEIRSSGTN